MCDFISHIEVTVNKRKKIYFLTGDQVFKTPRGEALRKHCGNDDDLPGHGAIRWFYELESTEGTNKECTDFASPKNFPPVIVKAIRRGEMRGLATPKGLLVASAWAEYDKVRASAEAEYDKVRASAWAEYDKVRASAWAEYDKVRASAEAEYDKVRANTFWDLFADTKNRVKAWR